jgi:hypothetical protein
MKSFLLPITNELINTCISSNLSYPYQYDYVPIVKLDKNYITNKLFSEYGVKDITIQEEHVIVLHITSSIK